VIDTLTKKFANLETLESLSGLVGQFSVKAEELVETPEKEEKVVPQTFENVDPSVDAVSELAKIWNS
jgi:hypothetical protein